MGENVSFNIEVTMGKRWANEFCSMLNLMQMFGARGHSAVIGFYADGDGDFNPKFDIKYQYEPKEGFPRESLTDGAMPEVLFDAG